MKIKSLVITVSFFLLAHSVNAQTETVSFDSSLQRLTDALAVKLKKDTALKMAVWDLSDLNGGVSPIGKYIAEDISINLSDKFHVTNRNQLSTFLKENKLASEGFINQATLKQVKKFSDIDILITGTVSILSENIKITLQALDDNGNIVGATKGDVPMNADVKELLGINTGVGNKGFNRPLSSNEQVNNPETVNSECATNNVGDYCFTNTKQDKVEIHVGVGDPLQVQYGTVTIQTLTLDPNQTQCFYNLKAIVYTYIVLDSKVDRYNPIQSGQIKIEQCKSKTFIIR